MNTIVFDDRRQPEPKKENGDDLLTLENIDNNFKDAIREIKDLYRNIYKTLPQILDKEQPLADNILRSQVFFLDSALDLYVSDIVKYFFKEYTKDYKSEKDFGYVFTVNFETLKQCMYAQDADKIHKLLLDSFGYWFVTCMKYDTILKYLKMVGINLPSKYTNTTEKSYQDMKRDIDNLSNRRNKIGHNSDLDKNRKKITIKPGMVNNWINKVVQLQELIQQAAAKSAFPNKQ